MITEQERADFEAWAQNSFELHRHSAGEYSSNFTQTAWAAWQARAALQSQEYTAAIGGAGQAYLDRFKNAHALPAEFRWSELWAVMCLAANTGSSKALQSQDREDAFCVWHNDPETDSTWETGCGNLFILNDGTPAENRMRFCCYCGRPLVTDVVTAEDDDDDNQD